MMQVSTPQAHTRTQAAAQRRLGRCEGRLAFCREAAAAAAAVLGNTATAGLPEMRRLKIKQRQATVRPGGPPGYYLVVVVVVVVVSTRGAWARAQPNEGEGREHNNECVKRLARWRNGWVVHGEGAAACFVSAALRADHLGTAQN